MEHAVKSISDDTFDAEVLGADRPVLVDFWAPWCGPCRMVGPVMESIATDRGSDVKIVKVNIDDNARVAGKLGIRSIPTVMLFNNGELRETLVGARPRADFDRLLDREVGADLH